jgi:hypothetical protein
MIKNQNNLRITILFCILVQGIMAGSTEWQYYPLSKQFPNVRHAPIPVAKEITTVRKLAFRLKTKLVFAIFLHLLQIPQANKSYRLISTCNTCHKNVNQLDMISVSTLMGDHFQINSMIVRMNRELVNGPFPQIKQFMNVNNALIHAARHVILITSVMLIV